MNIKLFKSISIRQKLLIIFQFMSIPIIVIFIVLIFVINKLQYIQSKILLENFSSITAAYNVENSILSLKGLKTNYILDNDKKWLREFDDNVNSFNYWYNQAFKSANTEKEKNILSAMSIDFNRYTEYHKKIIILADSNRKAEAINLLFNNSLKNYEAIYSGCEDLIKTNKYLISKSEEKLNENLKLSKFLGYIIAICFIILGAMLVIIVTKSIVDPIREMEKESDSILTIDNKKSEIEGLKERFNKMVETIKANQQKIIQSERRAAIGEISAGISHELNNPIGIICGFSEILIKKQDVDPENMEFINDIYKEAIRCKKLLGQFLDFARSPELHYTKSNIIDLIKKTIELLEKQEKYEKIKFSFKSPREEIIFDFDSVQIRQVILNIILNACDAVSFCGTINVEVEMLKKGILIKIEDNGVGIKEEDISKIFIPFYTTKIKGVGLGLAVCDEIVSKHNGHIDVSCKGPGAEFRIFLPGCKNE